MNTHHGVEGMGPISADVNRIAVDGLADGDERAIHTNHKLVKLVALLKADGALVQHVTLWKNIKKYKNTLR